MAYQGFWYFRAGKLGFPRVLEFQWGEGGKVAYNGFLGRLRMLNQLIRVGKMASLGLLAFKVGYLGGFSISGRERWPPS